MKSRICTPLTIMSLIFCAIVFMGCVNPTTSPSKVQVPTSIQIPTTTVVTPPVSKEIPWATFKSQDWGFSIQYPNDWTPGKVIMVSKSDPSIVLSETLNINSPEKDLRVEIDIDEPKESLDKAVEKFIDDQLDGWRTLNPIVTEKTKMTISGYPATKVVVTKDEKGTDGSITGKSIQTAYLISTPNHFYYIWDLTGGTTGQNNFKSTVNRMVKSFTILS
jgi:hypothetical protein